MITGIALSLIAGALIGLQNIFNSKVNEHAGSWATTVLVLGLGFAASFTLGLIIEGANLFKLDEMKTWFWFSGLLGVGVVTCITQGVRRLGPTYGISIALTSQLVFAFLFDSIGAFGLEKVPFTFQQLISVLVIVGGILVFKLGGRGKAASVEMKEKRLA